MANITCSRCGTANPADNRFCGSCGSALSAAQPQGERRWATIMFGDLSGFTRMSESMDPEDVRDLIDECMDALGAIAERYEGHFARVIGDALMVYFGVPTAHDDDPERAVRAALEMQSLAASKAELFGGLPLRIGINTGLVMFAPVGPGTAREDTVMGDAVNTASRLESASPAGGVLVGEQTYLATRDSIRYEPVEAIQAKGKKEAVRAWLAVEPMRAEPERRVSSIPMVGRDREMDLLRLIWSRVAEDHRPHLVTILGPPGIGKTRLFREFTEAVVADGAVSIHGRCLPYGETSGYGPFAQQVRALAGIYETDPQPDAAVKLGSLVRSVVAPSYAEEVERHVAVMIGLTDTEVVEDRQPLFLAARTLIEALGRSSPTVLVFEDIHWAPPTVLELIEVLAERSRDSAVLLLALSRPELMSRRPGWGGGLASATSIVLEPLRPDESRGLVTKMLGHDVPPDVLDRLIALSEGNPLFVEELSATVGERTAGGLSRELPTSIHGIIAARLDGLPAIERQLLLHASVQGKVFWRAGLEATGATDGDPAPVLDSLERRDLIRRERISRIQGDDEFTFKHMLIREVAYETLPKTVRRELHGQIAGYLERALGEAAGESSSLLAHHWKEAAESDRAVRYLLVAAAHADRTGAKGEAVSLYREALDLLPEGESSDRRDIGVRLILTAAAGGEFLTEEMDRLLPQLDGTQEFDVLATKAKAAFWNVDADEMRPISTELTRMASELGDARSRATALWVASQVRSLDGDIGEAIRIGDESIDNWPVGQRPGELAVNRGQLGLFRYWRGDYEGALEMCLPSLEVGRELRSVEAQLNGGPHAALALAGLGRHEESLALFEDVIGVGRELELTPRWTGRAISMWAGTLRELNDASARGLMEEALDMMSRARFLTGQVQTRVDMLYEDVDRGELGGAEAAWHQIADRAEGLKGWHEWLVQGRMLHLRARIMLALGRAEAACEAAQDSLEHAQRYRRAKYVVGSHTELSRALRASGRHAEAVAASAEAVREAEKLGHPPSVWQAMSARGQALVAVGQDDEATEAMSRAREVVTRFAEALSPARRSTFLGSAPVSQILAGELSG